jgi:hypothetical protein
MLETARELVLLGYACHWLKPRSKAPLAAGWAQAPVASSDAMQTTFRPGLNLGIRCGRWSQPRDGYGLLVLDVDIHAPQYQDEATEAVEALLPECLEVPVVLSGRGLGSRHLWFTCPLGTLPSKANITLAQGPDPAENTWRLELLSTGKQVVCPPSVHPETGRLYAWAWPDLMPFVPPTAPDAIMQAIDSALQAKTRETRPAAGRTAATFQRHHESIADAFRCVPWADILEPHGWQFVREQGGRAHWVRPGKEARDGISATTTGDVLYCFSSSTAFEAERGYNKFQAYAILEHSGDMSQAARHLLTLQRGRAA